MKTVFIGNKPKTNGNYNLVVSTKLLKSFSCWTECRNAVALGLLELLKARKQALNNSGNLQEKLQQFNHAKKLQIELRIAYSQLPDSEKNNMLLQAIENYQYIA